MAEAKTRPGALTTEEFLAATDPARQSEARQLLALFQEVTGHEPVVWGGTMLGFGRYAYRYASGHAGESLATGFAPRRAELVLYGLATGPEQTETLARLGKHRLGKACLYLRRLEGVDRTALAQLIRAGLKGLAARWPILP